MDAGAGVHLISISPPESLHDTTECRGELWCPGTERGLPPETCASLWKAGVSGVPGQEELQEIDPWWAAGLRGSKPAGEILAAGEPE